MSEVPTDTGCPSELGACVADVPCFLAASVEDDPATPEDETEEACDENALCVAWRGCEMSAAAAGIEVAEQCQAQADECFGSPACLAALSTEDDPSTPDDERHEACDASALCMAFVDCQLLSEVPSDSGCAASEGACFADPACLAALSVEDDAATPVDEFLVACSLNSLCTTFMDCQFDTMLPGIYEMFGDMCPAPYADCAESADCMVELEASLRQGGDPPTDGSPELMNLLTCVASQLEEEPTDVICMDPTGDGIVGTGDLLMLLALYGRDCAAASGVSMCP